MRGHIQSLDVPSGILAFQAEANPGMLTGMDHPPPPAPLTLHLYCRVDVVVTDPQALVDRAVAELRDADLDWSEEDDDLDSATAELRGSIAASLGAVADISRVAEGVPGVEFRGGRSWVEPGPPREITPPVGAV
ncbi:hypothetical protein [Micromonospora sp. NPDC051296]|uniref:hypothetical protein n=1 Tax=Micromonospora sp. NPDC051296 TaxID=3155046 RepID=UPI00343ADBEC